MVVGGPRFQYIGWRSNPLNGIAIVRPCKMLILERPQCRVSLDLVGDARANSVGVNGAVPVVGKDFIEDGGCR